MYLPVTAQEAPVGYLDPPCIPLVMIVKFSMELCKNKFSFFIISVMKQ